MYRFNVYTILMLWIFERSVYRLCHDNFSELYCLNDSSFPCSSIFLLPALTNRVESLFKISQRMYIEDANDGRTKHASMGKVILNHQLLQSVRSRIIDHVPKKLSRLTISNQPPPAKAHGLGPKFLKPTLS